MKSLFDSILIVVSFTLLCILYFVFKSAVKRHKEKRRIKALYQIYKAEKRAKISRELHELLKKMKEEETFWAEVYMHGKENRRFRIERRPGEQIWQLSVNDDINYKNLVPNTGNDIDLVSNHKGVKIIEFKDYQQIINSVMEIFDRINNEDETVDIVFKY